jgi:hypothetical protein
MKHEDFMKAKQAELNNQWMRTKAAQANLQSDNVDMVNSPPHYNHAGIECIEAIEAALTPEEFRGYCKGNNIKYTWRENYKNKDEDLAKANWYLSRLLKQKES